MRKRAGGKENEGSSNGRLERVLAESTPVCCVHRGPRSALCADEVHLLLAATPAFEHAGAPEVAADAADLVLSAASGTIKMDTEKCGVVDACELAQAVADNAKALGAL